MTITNLHNRISCPFVDPKRLQESIQELEQELKYINSRTARLIREAVENQFPKSTYEEIEADPENARTLAELHENLAYEFAEMLRKRLETLQDLQRCCSVNANSAP